VLQAVVKNKDYKQAHAIQGRLRTLADVEKKHWRLQQQAKLEQHLALLRKSQQKELASLRMRTNSGMNELQRQRTEERQALSSKRRSLTSQQVSLGRTSSLPNIFAKTQQF
jgi:hypothetical protein